MTPVALRASMAALALLAAWAAAAQQLYRWTDEKGRTHVTDTPPPPSAKDVRKKSLTGGSSEGEQLPFELAVAVKDFPVVFYSAPTCKLPCSDARALFNRRGVPFKEVVVWDQDSAAELTAVVGSVFIPSVVVGRSVQKGFTPASYEALLDSARYPKEGVVPARSQGAPPPPKGYTEAKEEVLKAEPVPPEAEQPKGPYSPGAPRQQRPTPAQK